MDADEIIDTRRETFVRLSVAQLEVQSAKKIFALHFVILDLEFVL